jgi:hypothetical protein
MGASHKKIFPRFSSGSISNAISELKMALPKSINTKTPSSEYTCSMASKMRMGSVPSMASSTFMPPAA